MKPDEKAFLLKLAAERPMQTMGKFATDVAAEIGMHVKRAEYLLQKWTDKGWFNYGVSARSGWLTEAGFAFAKQLKEQK